ncbi:unnamed protein product [Rodentolepis nana]|uniref:PID domain-containing protein n=1 Tax=Rodentolepis nana TaxID=102285 RepID=A0A0R3TR43_RODNA|nr:unnamed protein product [Rodentolepis nana]
MLLGALYATSACVMFGTTVYFAVKRGETFEAAQRISGPVSFIVKYSRNGEPVNLYLRLGLARKFRHSSVCSIFLEKFNLPYNAQNIFVHSCVSHGRSPIRCQRDELRQYQETAKGVLNMFQTSIAPSVRSLVPMELVLKEDHTVPKGVSG